MRGLGLYGSSVLALAWTGTLSAQPAPMSQVQAEGETETTIVVTADRALLAALRGIEPERTFDDADVGDYGSSTVGEFLEEIQAQNGDAEAIFLVDGELVTDLDDIADFPAEAIERVEVLPRGAGQRVGRESNRRVYNISLKQQVRSATLNASRRIATRGAWGESEGEVIFTRIKERDRLNLTLRGQASDSLLLSDREVELPLPLGFLSADLISPINPAAFRTLRPETKNFEASLIGFNRLTDRFSTNYSLRGRTTRETSLGGLPSGTFLQPISGSLPRLIGAFGNAPLDQQTVRDSLNANLALNGNFGRWTANLTGQANFSWRQYSRDRQNGFYDREPLSTDTDPGVAFPSATFSIVPETTRSEERNLALRASAAGPVVRLPAGPVRLRGALEEINNSVDSSGTGNANSFSREERRIESGLELPLASRSEGFLPVLGELSIGFEQVFGIIRDRRNSRRSTFTGRWQPTERLNFNLTLSRNITPPSPDLLADPVVVFDDVTVFDFQRGIDAQVAVVTGGNPALLPLDEWERRFAVSAAPWPEINLQLNAEYRASTRRDFTAAIPPASADIFAAFPERFGRDEGGRLFSVDSRPANFDRQDRHELRTAASFVVPLGPARATASPSPDEDASTTSFARSELADRTRLQVTVAHGWLFEDSIVARPSLPAIDLLAGGAIGFGGGQPRHLIDGSFALSQRGLGLRLAGNYRAATALLTRDAATISPLRFSSLATFNLRAFAESSRFAPDIAWLKQTRVSLTANNLFDTHQVVSDRAGFTPLPFQPAYRDPIGRTLELEIRKVL